MQERRAKDLCFNCDKIYYRGRQCKKLLWFEVIEDVECLEGDLGIVTFVAVRFLILVFVGAHIFQEGSDVMV